uniref:SAM domain-containing protein n=1 Tax=Rhizophagus irregularis (strain DAOM 181602 / DAOM 197198 / MUCL 43194) TaxID=747089 RepID=U9TUA9_RHIID
MTRLKRKSLKDTRTTPLKTSKSNSKGNLKLNGKSKISDKSNVIKEVCEILSDNDDDEIYENKIEISEELNKENIMDDPFEDTVVTDEETDTEIDNDLDVKEFKETLSEISFKLIIKQERESSAAAISQTTFKDFRKKLNLLVQNQLDKWVRYDDYIVSYKLGKETGSGIQLTDERDWIRFLTEYNKFHSKKKELVIFASIKSRKNNSQKEEQALATIDEPPSFPIKPIPTIQEFLENLDNTYGSQKFTCFLERIVSESIDILDIQILTDSDFEKLGISSIGVKTKLVREAKNYSSS